MPIKDEDVAALAVLLAPERSAVLNALTGSTRTAIELHQETVRLGASLMNVIASIEIALRNAICENLSKHFVAGGWLLNPPAPFQWREVERKKIALALDSARRSEYAKLSQADKHALDLLAFPNGRPPNLSHLDRAKARRAHIPVADGKMVAELTFYIWKRLCGPYYEHSLWKPTLRQIFPHKKVKRAEVAEHLEILYQVRNRLAHHEPVLHGRFSDAIDAIKFVVSHLLSDPPRNDTPLASLIAEDLAGVEAQAAHLHAKLNAYRI